jgi:energy-coupling factor transporter ATP-binding protein EcfA2
MLSEKTERHIQALLAKQEAYSPSFETSSALADKTLIMLVGPTGAGKSTVMQALTTLEPQISIVGTITTRPPRPDDQLERYTFYEHTDVGLRPLFDAIAEGRLVQYVVNPFSHQIYGSSLRDYPSAVNVGDYFSNVVEPFHRYGFGRIIPITIVTNAESWLKRFDARFPVGHPQRQSRHAEATASLTWSLGEHQTIHYFVLNPEDSPQSAAADILSILSGSPPEQTHIRATAEQCLASIQKLEL